MWNRSDFIDNLAHQSPAVSRPHYLSMTLSFSSSCPSPPQNRYFFFHEQAYTLATLIPIRPFSQRCYGLVISKYPLRPVSLSWLYHVHIDDKKTWHLEITKAQHLAVPYCPGDLIGIYQPMTVHPNVPTRTWNIPNSNKDTRLSVSIETMILRQAVRKSTSIYPVLNTLLLV